MIVSGGKQYRVAPGDRILVDRLAEEPGSSIKLGRVLMFSDGEDVRVGNPVVDGLDVEAKVIAHRRGPRIESIRYKSKKRVRVHAGGRAYLTALEIIAVGGVGLPKPEEEEEEGKPKKKSRGRAKAAPKKRAETKTDTIAEVVEEEPQEEKEEAPKKTTTRRRPKKETK
ncbi:MAG TPA: 50S ribosomal protein L21 [Candidatus Dormibacteraeota bacterium]|nr:50S ribosomal protein L21 [Candidatus Dormibacteraeota bacterium]